MHYKEKEEIFRELSTSQKGLSEDEVQKRIQKFGLNEIKEGKKTSPWQIFFAQFNSVVMYILMAATVISGILQEYIDAIVIGVIVVLIAVLGFVQEYKAERAIEALKKMASLKATVIRDGSKKSIDAKFLVQGDIIVLQTGDKVPADARLIEIFNLQAQEAALTGESNPIKKEDQIFDEKTPLADRKNMVFSGTIIVGGRATAVVTGTGMQSEIGKIATMIEGVETEDTPLQKKMDQLGKWIAKIVIAVAVIIFITEITEILIKGLILDKGKFLELLLVAVAVAVAAIPEGLPAVVTMSLALGTQRMLKKNALIRRLPSVETLGSTTVICTDKTGTLTANQMTVRKLFVNGKIIEVTGVGYEPKGEFLYKNKPARTEEIDMLLAIGAANNDAELSEGKINGDPTEGALIVCAAKSGILKADLAIEMPRVDEIEFTSERKMMTTIHKHHGEKLSYVKGAPEVVVKLCSYIYIDGKIRKITEEEKEEILEVNHKFADDAMRVLGFAYKNIIKDPNPEKNLVFVGLQAMIDPPRPEVREAIEKCKKAGIRVIMITGDHEITAKAVAREIGLEGKSLTGKQLDEMDSLDSVVDDVCVFARVNPEHKIKIVDALKKKGHIVAMTGDGVNDAPALKKADIGIAMGISGTDVAKEASAMILTDDNFTSIVNAVEEGRGTYDNIRKYFGFLISGNIGEVLIVFLGIIFGLPLPLTATQILLINLVTDGLPALALSADPFEPNAMDRKPRSQKEQIYRGLRAFIVYYPAVMVASCLGVFLFYYNSADPSTLLKAQTATFLTISMFELYQAFACRSVIYPSWRVGYFRNKWLILAVASSLTIIASGVYIPGLGTYLDMTYIPPLEFLAIVVLASLGAIVIELSKYFDIRRIEKATAAPA